MTDSTHGPSRLVSRSGKSLGRDFWISSSARIGRSRKSEIVLEDPGISGSHARVYRDDAHWYVEDLGSRNGTRVDGVLVEAPERLGRLNVLQFARDVTFIFQGPEIAARAAEGRDVSVDDTLVGEPLPPSVAATPISDTADQSMPTEDTASEDTAVGNLNQTIVGQIALPPELPPELTDDQSEDDDARGSSAEEPSRD